MNHVQTKILQWIAYIFFLSICAQHSSAQFSLGIELGGSAPLSKDSTYNGTFYMAPRLDIPNYTFMYGFYPNMGSDPATSNLHTLDAGWRYDVGKAPIIPYFLVGGGFAFFNTTNKYLLGTHLFATFGLNSEIIISKYYYGTGGLLIRYNALPMWTDGYFIPGDNFSIYQFLTLAAVYQYIF